MKKHRAEDKSKGKPEGRKEEKRKERKEEAKPKKKDPKGKARRIVADDDDDTPDEVQQIKTEPARMASEPRRAPRPTHLEVPEGALSPCGSARSSSSKSGSSKSSTSSSSGSSSSSSESDESAEKSPVLQKGALKAAKTEVLEKGKDKARPHFLVETHGRPPSKLPTGQTRQEKFTRSAHHVRSMENLKSFFNNEDGYSLGTFVHHYKNCCGQLKAETALKVCVCTTFRVLCMEALPASPGTVAGVARVEFVAHAVSACVPGDIRVVERVFRVPQCVKIWASPRPC